MSGSTTVLQFGDGENQALARAAFVGRERELAELRAALAEAKAGRGRLLLVSGEPGIGKSRLCEELAELATATDCKVTWGRCWEAGGAPAYWPWIQVLRDCAQFLSPHKMEAVAGRGATHLARLLPELFGQQPPVWPAAEAKSAIEPSQSDTERFGLFDAVAAFLTVVAKEAPLVIILDDLHAADRESVLLAQLVARALRPHRIVLIATYREAEVRIAPELAELIGQLGREGQSMRLPGLGRADVSEFVRFSTRKPADDSVAGALYRATEGNPLFLSEIVRLLIAQRRIDDPRAAQPGVLELPDTVRNAIRKRIGLIAASTQKVLRTVSTFGREFDLALARGLCNLSYERLEAMAEQACRVGLLSRVAEASGRYRFAHALFAETLYEDLSAAARRKLHHRIATILEQRWAQDSGVDCSALAHHYFRALPASLDKAVFFACRAAESSARAFAFEEASRLYRMALTALAPANRAQRAELLLALGEAQCLSRDFAAFKPTFLEVAALARELGEPKLLARAALGYGMVGNYEATDATTVALLEEAISALGGSHPRLRAAIYTRLAEEVRWSRPAEEPCRLLAQAIDIARSEQDSAGLVEALYMKQHVMRGPDTAGERLAICAEIVEVARSARLDHWLLRARYHRAAALLELNEVEEFYKEFEAIKQIPEALRFGTQGLSFAEIADIFEAMRALAEGRVGEGEQLAARALSMGSHRPSPAAGQIAIVQNWLARREQGRLGEVRPMLAELATRHPRLSAFRCMLAFCDAQLGCLDEARSHFDRLAGEDFAGIDRDFTWLLCLACLAETCFALNDGKRAAVLYTMLRPYASRNASVGSFAYMGPITYYLALLALTLERFDEAGRHFEAALEAERKMNARCWIARTQTRYAQMLVLKRGRDDLERARQLTALALGTAVALGLVDVHAGADALSAHLESIAAAAGGGSALAAPASAVNLFRKDSEYWTMSYGGQSVQLRDRRGFYYIAHLMRHCDEEVSSGLLGSAVAREDGGLVVGGSEISAGAVLLSDAGELLDPQALGAYRARAVELRQELEEAQSFNDLGRIEKCQNELDFLARELARATGLGGRERRAGSHLERARVRVTNAIKMAIARIRQSHPALGGHLESSIKTGSFCSYSPDPAIRIDWQF